MKKIFLLTPLLVLTLATAVLAAPAGRLGGPRGAPRKPPSFLKVLVQPETVMENQAKVELSEEQRQKIQAILHQARASIADTRWEMAEKGEAARGLLSAQPIDQGQALETMQELFSLETTMKTRNLEMLIGITNVLRPEQRKQLLNIQNRKRKARREPR